jgi:hypothetical protein
MFLSFFLHFSFMFHSFFLPLPFIFHSLSLHFGTSSRHHGTTICCGVHQLLQPLGRIQARAPRGEGGFGGHGGHGLFEGKSL